MARFPLRANSSLILGGEGGFNFSFYSVQDCRFRHVNRAVSSREPRGPSRVLPLRFTRANVHMDSGGTVVRRHMKTRLGIAIDEYPTVDTELIQSDSISFIRFND